MEASDPQTLRAGTRRTGTARVALVLAVVIAVFAGWRAFWFLTDDAFIAFRYVSNQMLGHGLSGTRRPSRPWKATRAFSGSRFWVSSGE